VKRERRKKRRGKSNFHKRRKLGKKVKGKRREKIVSEKR
jgi:hypothetical protein